MAGREHHSCISNRREPDHAGTRERDQAAAATSKSTIAWPVPVLGK